MRKNLRAIWLLACVVLFIAFTQSPLLAIGGFYPLDRLVKESELIVVAKPTAHREGWTQEDTLRNPIGGPLFTVRASVLREIKGHCDREITIQVALNDRWSRGIDPTGTQLFFLRHGNGLFLAANPKLVSLPAVDGPGVQRESNSSDLELIMQELGLVMTSPYETAERKSEVLFSTFLAPRIRTSTAHSTQRIALFRTNSSNLTLWKHCCVGMISPRSKTPKNC